MNTRDMFDVSGQVVIITGASSGLGAMMARGFADAGCSLILAARREKQLAAVADAVAESGGQVRAVSCDVRDGGHGALLVGHALEHFGRLDGVVLNAGIATMGPAEAEPIDDFARVMEVNVTAQMRLAKEAAQAMITGAGGWMITLSSILGRRAGTGGGLAGYTSSKGAIEQLTRELARQWAPHGIRVNSLSPGVFPTPMNEPMMANPEREEQIRQRIPIGRFGEPQDIVGAALFLASPAAAYITGHVLAVDGGMSAW